MDNFTQKYNIDRKAASRLLKVSVRTVDRYIKRKVLTTQNVGGRIWLNKEDVLDLTTKKIEAPIDTYDDMSIPVTTIDTTQRQEEQPQEVLSTSPSQRIENNKEESHFYEKMYEEIKGDIREKEERLEIANYRVGQLEAQLKNSIPLLEYHRESSEKKMEKAKLIEKLEQTESRLTQFAKKLKLEEYNRKVLFTILLILMSLQPLWLLLLKK